MASLQAEFEAAFQLVFFVTQLLGRVETGTASPEERALLRVLTPLAKLWTGKLAVRIASEACEAFGGAGYIENTGIPQLLRDAQVYPIWEAPPMYWRLTCCARSARTESTASSPRPSRRSAKRATIATECALR